MDIEIKSLIETKRYIEINSLIEKERSPVHVHALVAAPSSLVTIKWAWESHTSYLSFSSFMSINWRFPS